MRLLLVALAACSSVDAAPQSEPMFSDRMQFRLPCWSSMPHVTTARVGDLSCRVDATATVDGISTARVVCDRVRETIDPISRPMLEGWYVRDPDAGTYYLGYGLDRDRPLLPTFGWQQQQPFGAQVLAMMRDDGPPEIPDRPTARTWEAWENDDYSMDEVTYEHGDGWCTTRRESGSTTRWDICFSNGRITGAAKVDYAWWHDPRCKREDPICMAARDPRHVIEQPANSWTMHTRCGNAPRLYME